MMSIEWGIFERVLLDGCNDATRKGMAHENDATRTCDPF